MNDRLYINPGKLKTFGEQAGCTFSVVTTPELKSHIQLNETSSAYGAYMVVTASSTAEAHQCIAEKIPDRSHILVVMPSVYFKSPGPDVLGPKKKLGVLACFSTPTDTAQLNHFLRQAEKTDPESQRRYAEFFFEVGQKSEYLELINDEYGTRAVFNHLDDSLMWHEQVGPLDWGEQQLLPSGEISVLPVEVFGQDINQALDVSGSIAVKGLPILHSGSVSFQRKDQSRIYDQLSTLYNAAIRLECEHGYVTEIDALDAEARDAARYFNMLREIDSRYGVILEMGFGCNFTHELIYSNSAMNEVHGNPTGVIHLGFGLLPYTQY
ncbi:MAG TPA: hypothetical protein VF435_04170, partial [Pyrinomonadaceae bacterium]